MIKDLKSKITKKNILITLSLTMLTLPPGLFISLKTWQSNPARAKNTFLSPLVNNQSTETDVKTGSLPIYSLEYYLNLSKSFLTKATRLANDDPQQTEVEKLKIISTLNQSLKAVNEAIKYYPNRPEPYLARAQLYQKVQHLWPEVKKQAQKDLEIANKLMNSTPAPERLEKTAPEAENHPLDFIPAQKANLAQNITIATPQQKTDNKKQKAEIETNALSGTGILPAKKTEVTIQAQQLTTNHLIYVVPKGDVDNKTLYVKARKNGQWFKVGIDSPSDKDIVFSWWIINR